MTPMEKFMLHYLARSSCTHWRVKIIEEKFTLEQILERASVHDICHMTEQISNFRRLDVPKFVAKFAKRMWNVDISEHIHGCFNLNEKVREVAIRNTRVKFLDSGYEFFDAMAIVYTIVPSWSGSFTLNGAEFLITDGKKDQERIRVFLEIIEEHLAEVL